jgi:hypothetical protein
MNDSINPEKLNVITEHSLDDLNNEDIVEMPVQYSVKSHKEPPHPFWAEDPNILLRPEHALEFFPTESMSFNQKLNAITRIVLTLTTISYIVTNKINLIIVSVISIVCIYLMYFYHKKEDLKRSEGFRDEQGNLVKLYDRNGPTILIPEQTIETNFQTAKPSNPLSNVLISDYDYNPNKKPAQPSYTKEGKDSILEETKNTIQLLNEGHPDIEKKLFQDVNDNLELEQSMRQFYSTANTTIPNDQDSFVQFCYGDMISNKEGNAFAAVRNNPRHNMY